MRCIQLACDPGDDVNGTLVIPDGTIVDFDMKEDPNTRELVSISRWEVVNWDDRESDIARRFIAVQAASAFDRLVFEHYQSYLKDTDKPLPGGIYSG